MKKIILTLIALAIIGAGVYYLVFSYKAPSDDNSAGTPGNTKNTVIIENFSFIPPALTVKTGETVTWVNKDPAPHTINSDAPGLFDSPSISQGESFEFTFIEAGSIGYFCGLHPNMKASIVVEN